METNKDRLAPFKPTHPGEILKEELKERGIKQKDFATLIGMQASHLNAFIKGKRNLNENLAIKLEEHLGIPYTVWMDLHSGYIYESKTFKSPKNQQTIILYSIHAAICDIARKLSLKGMPQTDIAEVTGLPPEEIQSL